MFPVRVRGRNKKKWQQSRLFQYMYWKYNDLFFEYISGAFHWIFHFGFVPFQQFYGCHTEWIDLQMLNFSLINEYWIDSIPGRNLCICVYLLEISSSSSFYRDLIAFQNWIQQKKKAVIAKEAHKYITKKQI